MTDTLFNSGPVDPAAPPPTPSVGKGYAPPADASRYQQDIARYWNQEQAPVNLRLGEVDGVFHHHYGIGEVDLSVLAAPPERRDEAVIAELHRLEGLQADLLLEHLGELGPADRVLDAGSGRGGTSFLAHQRFGCHVDGVSLSQKQVDFANRQAHRLEVQGKVRFHLANMLETGFTTGTYQAIWNNESTMYVDLADLFAAHSALLRRGGRYVTVTGCYNDVYGQIPSKQVSTINAWYECGVHPRSAYFKAMAANRLAPITVTDLTAATIPYWELRAKSAVASGIEEAFLSAYRNGSFTYLLIAADRI